MESNSFSDTLILLLLLQLVGALIFVLGGLYVLYCFNRAAAGLERMATVAETWLALQHYQMQQQSAPNQTPAQSPTDAVVAVEPLADETTRGVPPTSFTPPAP